MAWVDDCRAEKRDKFARWKVRVGAKWTPSHVAVQYVSPCRCLQVNGRILCRVGVPNDFAAPKRGFLCVCGLVASYRSCRNVCVENP